MADYIKLDDAKRAIYEGALIFASSQLNIAEAMLSAFGEIKKADVVEAVRCAECKHLVPYGGIVGLGAYECERLKTSRTGIFPPMGFYCAWGEKIERKDEAPDA